MEVPNSIKYNYTAPYVEYFRTNEATIDTTSTPMLAMESGQTAYRRQSLLSDCYTLPGEKRAGKQRCQGLGDPVRPVCFQKLMYLCWQRVSGI